jgi:hypothetical protein
MLLVSTLGAANETLDSSYLFWVSVYILAQFGLGFAVALLFKNYIAEIAVFETTGLIRFKNHVVFRRKIVLQNNFVMFFRLRGDIN